MLQYWNVCSAKRVQTFLMKPPTAHTKTKPRCDVGGNQGFLLSHEQLLTEGVGGDNVKYITQTTNFSLIRNCYGIHASYQSLPALSMLFAASVV